MVSLYEITIPVFIRNLEILKKLLDKGSADGKVTEQQLLDSRLIPDMGNLIFQIQRISDTSKGLVARVGNVAPVAIDDNEKTFKDLHERIQKTIDVLKSVKESDWAGKETADVVTRTGDKIPALKFALENAIPNHYFHFVTAYGLLRKEGVDVGKKDYLGLV